LGKRIQKVLIANRGEIAVRVIRACREMSIETVAVYSEADADALHVRVADEAYLIGPPPARESYLVIEKLIEAASLAHADCIHPGYGFLSENPQFAEACEAAGIVFVGPPPSAIRAMGLKDQAKALMEKAGVPVVPGYHGELQDPKFLREKAYQIGYPVLIKAVAGGGGKGMRRVDKHAEFDTALESATREAQSSFGDTRVLIEKYVTAPRHIEMQVFADSHGNVIHLNERDCSLQRRHQKVIEEAPAPGMTAQVREMMGRAATEAARAVGYQGAGTVEFIADGAQGLRTDGFWFMEMNTRLQVEHPVTEAITGLDLVEMQFRVAAGERLALTQNDVRIDGHAAEARLYAEDPARNFLPSTGKLAVLEFPGGEGVRIDTGVEAGSMVSPDYDPMIAKVIAHGADREQALSRLAAALGETVVVGPHSNAAFLAALASHPAFRAGQFDTGFIDAHLAEVTHIEPAVEAGAVAAAVEALLTVPAAESADSWNDPWRAADGFSLGAARTLDLDIAVDGHPRTATVVWRNGPHATVDGVPAAQDARILHVGNGAVAVARSLQRRVTLKSYDAIDVDHLDGDGTVKAPMHGKVLAIFVAQGTSVTKGERVAVVEAMKMEHALLAPADGIVSEVSAEVGAQVAEGAKILVVETKGE
jgi:3-methylcrotonyl-CoA carboxylase alpha subunit